MNTIRLCRESDVDRIHAIVNAAAEAYRGVIPTDRWHEPYMPLSELEHEMGAGVVFWGCERAGELVGVMGIQPVRDVELIRHAYVRPDHQRHGIGAALIEHLLQRSTKPLLVGTWASATWAIDFYRRHGFQLVSSARTRALLTTYWNIPERQIETSVVLAFEGSESLKIDASFAATPTP